MECGEMKVAGLGFRRDVSLASLREALHAAGGTKDLAALATISGKTETPALQLLAREFDVPIRTVSAEIIAGITTSTQSEFVRARFGAGSVAEAVAIVAAGPRARLISKRTVSRDRTATAAIAEGEGE
jgi:cobalt-precorrin 5A hydrolase